MTSLPQLLLIQFSDLEHIKCPSGNISDASYVSGFTRFISRFRTPSLQAQQYLKNTLLDFKQHQSYDKVYKSLLECDYLKNIVNRKSKHHQAGFKEHITRYLRWLHKDSGFNIEACHIYKARKKAKRKWITKEDLSDSRASQKQIKQSQKYQLRVTELIL